MKFSFLIFLLFFRPAGAETWQNITVENIEKPYLAQLPKGEVNLKTFRADLKLIQTYSLEYKVEEGQKKDFEKAPNCTRAEVHALRSWANNSVYREINPKLRQLKDGKVKGKSLSQKAQNQILMIASGINCAPQFEGAVVRIEDPPDFILAQYRPGDDIVVKGFTATTKGEKPAKSMFNEVKTRQTIWIVNGKGADIDFMEIATWKKEKEVLLSPGTVFRVVSKEVNLDPELPKSKDPQKIQYKFIFEQLN